MIAFRLVTRKPYGFVTNQMNLLLFLESSLATFRSLPDETTAARATFWWINKTMRLFETF